jgi:alkylhydroperoxidase family enzyme
MTVISEIEWDACLIEPRRDDEFERRYRQETGRPASGARYVAGVPWLAEALIDWAVEIERRVVVDAELADLVGLVVSQDNSCRYCFATMRFFLIVLGVPDAKIRRLEEQLLSVDFSPEQRAALDFARRVSRSDPLPTPIDLQTLRTHGYSDLEVAELVAVVGLHLFFNRLSTLIAMPPQQMESMTDRWYIRFVRPILALRLRNVRQYTKPVYLEPGEIDGPYAHVIRGLDGLPLAGVLRRSVDEMLASTLLTRRCKLLVLAVIARAMGCQRSEDEATGLLSTDGLDRAEIDRILSHLSSPLLDPIEKLAIPFARETVWYQPMQIQRRGREVMETLSREQFLELVGVAAVGNVLCRASIAERTLA